MTPKKKNEQAIKNLDELKKELAQFNQKASLKEQKKELKRIANKILQINEELQIDSTIELGTDVFEIVGCAMNPTNILLCIQAMGAVIDELKMAKKKKII